MILWRKVQIIKLVQFGPRALTSVFPHHIKFYFTSLGPSLQPISWAVLETCLCLFHRQIRGTSRVTTGRRWSCEKWPLTLCWSCEKWPLTLCWSCEKWPLTLCWSCEKWPLTLCWSCEKWPLTLCWSCEKWPLTLCWSCEKWPLTLCWSCEKWPLTLGCSRSSTWIKVHSTQKAVALRETLYTQQLTKHLSNSANSSSPRSLTTTRCISATPFIMETPPEHPPTKLWTWTHPGSTRSRARLHPLAHSAPPFFSQTPFLASSREQNKQFPSSCSSSC